MTTKATVILDSLNHQNVRITTVLVRLPALITPELLKHRIFSVSAASTRAIPTHKQRRQVLRDPYSPYHWGSNRPGMVPGDEVGPLRRLLGRATWRFAALLSVLASFVLDKLGVHKSIATRVMYPFLWMDYLITATEWDNFLALRTAPDADPEIHRLAWLMWDAMKASQPKHRDMHLPFIDDEDAELHTQRVLMFASAMRCARLSYGHVDGRPSSVLDDATAAEYKLARPRHMVPFEHSAMAKGVSQYANFKGWIQARQLYFAERGVAPWKPQEAERHRHFFTKARGK